jgi:hypothetical protein
MSLQIVDSGKPKWQTYSNVKNNELAQLRELISPNFTNVLFKKSNKLKAEDMAKISV